MRPSSRALPELHHARGEERGLQRPRAGKELLGQRGIHPHHARSFDRAHVLLLKAKLVTGERGEREAQGVPGLVP